MKTLFAAGFLFCLPLNHVTLQAEVQNPIAAFSTRAPGDSLPAGWRPRLLPNKKGPQFKLVTDHDVTVMRIESHAAAGTIAFDTHINPQATPLLTWRWKVDGVVEKGDLNVKSGDDFAARVYVFFDVPLSSLSFATRTQIQLARLVYGGPVPTAAICYVWDNKHPIGFSARSAYTDRVRNIVLQSGNGRARHWQTESRDMVQDFKVAFGAEWKTDTPTITGIAIGNDTDQTGETAVAYFGDFTFSAFKARP